MGGSHALGSSNDSPCMESTIKDYMSQYGRLRQQGFVNNLFHCKSRCWPSAKRQNCNKGIRGAFKGSHGTRARYYYGDQFSSFHHCSKHYTTHSNVAAKDRRWNSSTHKTTPWTSQRWSNPLIKTCRKGYVKLAGPLILRADGVGNGYAGVDQAADWLQGAEIKQIKQVNAGKNPTAHQINKRTSSNPLEALIERVIFNCRFVTLFAVVGSLAGSVICFLQGSALIAGSFREYFHAVLHDIDTGHVILSLVEAIDIFLAGTVLLIFGMGLYELFVNIIGTRGKENASSKIKDKDYTGSNLFGLFRLQERPLWLEIRSLHELKTKVGHVIVMILLVGMFEKSKKVVISTGLDLLCFSGSILMSSGCLFFLSKLQPLVK